MSTPQSVPFEPVPYPYEFDASDLDAIVRCNEEHGFAVAKGVLDDGFAEELRASVREVIDPDGHMKPGESHTKHAFVEFSPPLRKLLDHRPYMAIAERLVGTDQLSLHRSAAIIRQPGSSPVAWHTDWSFHTGEPRTTGDVLNRLEKPSGMWFYLTGSRPSHGGLCVIRDSHRMDWAGPEGFEFTELRKSFHPRGTEPRAYSRMDVPGVVPLVTDPGDLIIFNHRTYHGAFSNQEDHPRLSCALGLRPGREPFPVPWELPETALRLKRELPEHLQPYAAQYPSIRTDWGPEY